MKFGVESQNRLKNDENSKSKMGCLLAMIFGVFSWLGEASWLQKSNQDRGKMDPKRHLKDDENLKAKKNVKTARSRSHPAAMTQPPARPAECAGPPGETKRGWQRQGKASRRISEHPRLPKEGKVLEI